MGSEKKGGGGLDDLKARLGLDSVLSRARKEPPKPPEPEPTAPGGPSVAPAVGATPAAGFDATEGVEVPVPAPPPMDYSAAVSTFEEPVAGEGEPDPVLSASHKLVDLNLAVPVSRGAKIALMVVAIVSLVVALAAGFGFGKVMRDREVANQVIDTASRLIDQLQPVADGIVAFNQRLAGHSNEYSEDLQALFIETWQGGGPVVTSRAIADARIILTTGEDLTRDLLNYSLSTQILQAMVQEHMRKTITDRRLIQGLIAARGARATSYGVVFSWDDASQRFREFYESPAEVTFLPARGLVATFDDLEMQVQNPDSENPVYQYPVLIGGQQQMVAVYNLIVVDADQFVANPNEETALMRYEGRVARIREYMEQLIATQEILLERLRARAEGEHRFTI